jgi:hypothetical protein
VSPWLVITDIALQADCWCLPLPQPRGQLLGVPAKDVKDRELVLLTCLCRRVLGADIAASISRVPGRRMSPPAPHGVYAPTRENRLTL